MECSDYREMITMLLSGELNEEMKLELEKHLLSCTECRKEYESAVYVWNLMGEFPVVEPSRTMDERFSIAHENYARKMNKSNPAEWILARLKEMFSRSLFPRIAFSVFLVAAGISAGYFLGRPGNLKTAYNWQIDSLSSQVSELKQIMMLSLLKDQSASMRLQAVSYTDELSAVDRKVTEALLMTLNEDPNVNVRLATLEALAKLAGEPSVREGLVRSISNQDSPLVQSAIADVMVKLNEKSSVAELKKLLDRKDLNNAVKMNIEKSIQKLI